jgi:peptidoglycan/LPS O-acetylase OafA/YrhL
MDSGTIPRLQVHTTLPLPSKIPQIDGLQVLRAVAVLLVTMLHTRQDISRVAFGLPDFISYGVDLFFVISGFIMSSIVLRSRQPPGRGAAWAFLKRRLIRIFPIYWVFFLLILVRHLRHQPHFGLDYLSSFLLLPTPHRPYFTMLVDYSWTMMFEMYFYYVFAAVLLITVRRHAVALVIALLSSAVVLGLFMSIQRPYLIVVCCPLVLEFLFGAALALIHQKFGNKRGAGITLLAAGVIASFGLRNFTAITPDGLDKVASGVNLIPGVATWGIAATMIVGGMVFWQPAFKTKLGKIAVVLGNASYSTYLASGLAIEFADRLLVRIHPRVATPSFGVEATYQILIIASVFVVGWACYQFIEWPMLRSLQARTQKVPR